MRAIWKPIAVAMLGPLLALGAAYSAEAQLTVSYGPAGVQTLSYAGTTLEDLSVSPNDAFHIWHMKLTDMSGNVLSGPNYGWGENNLGKSWDLAAHTWTYRFVWGTVTVQFAQAGTSLNMTVTETNLSTSGVILDGASIYPFVLHLPQLPVGFMDASYPQLAFNTTAPSVTTADYGLGEVVAVVPSAQQPLYSGFLPAGSSNAYTPLISSTSPDSLASFQPHHDLPVQPGQTTSFVVSLRFAPSGTSPGTLASDAYSSWASTWPMQLNWADHRAIGTVYLASSPSGADVTQPGGFPKNPRRYFNESNPSVLDVTTATGLASFQARVLGQAATNVQNMQRLGAQGAITWDIEGEQFPQNTSYVCEPDLIASVAPEMETTITDPTSGYVGMKLDDAYFKIMTSAGLRVGVCIRPQHFTLAANGTASQVYLPDAAIVAELTRKIKYAHDRWGATLFYLDSTVEPDGGVLDAGLLQQVAASFPDSLLMPEEATPKGYAYTAPLLSYIFHGTLGTDPSIRNYYPAAFSTILINDADPTALAQNTSALTASVKAGDILMGHVDYWQANDPVIAAIYSSAGVGTTPGQPPPTNPVPPVAPPVTPVPPPITPTPPPVVPVPPPPVIPVPPPVTPVAPPTSPTSPLISITSPSAGDTVSGTIAVSGSLSVNTDAAGSYLMVDGQEIGTARVTGAPYAYALDTTMLAAGAHSLQLWAHDQNNEVLLSPVVTVTVAAATAPVPVPPEVPPPVAPVPVTPPVAAAPAAAVAIVYPLSGQAVSGVVQVSAVIAVQLDAAGSYLMVDGQEIAATRLTGPPYVFALDAALLSHGTHQLQIWAHDTANETLVSSAVAVMTLP